MQRSCSMRSPATTPNDPITAYSVGHIPDTYTSGLDANRLRGTRIGVLREPMDAGAEPSSDDYRKVRAVIDRAIEELAALGAEIVDPLVIPDLELVRGIGNNFETEQATDDYLAEHPQFSGEHAERDPPLRGRYPVAGARHDGRRRQDHG